MSAREASAPQFEYRGIGRRAGAGGCDCDACRFIVQEQLRALIARLPPAERLQRVLEACEEAARDE